MMSERSQRHNPAAHSRSRPTRAKRGGPSLTHRPHPTANFIRLRALAAVGPESREADGGPSFLEKRDRTRAELLHRKSSQCTQISPQVHRVRAPCPNKTRKDCVCHRVSNNEDADPHTILNALSARHDREKTVLLPECTLQTKQSVKRMMYSPGGPYIVVTPVVTSWAVAGQQVVFLHMYLQTRVTLRAFPVATPRGRSSKFPWRGTFNVYFNALQLFPHSLTLFSHN